MTSWTAFEQADPELGARARALISSTTNCVLGTLMADGSPRLSGIDPFFFEDHLYLGSMPGARKADDLRRDPRLALHGIPWESRKVKADSPDPGDGDVKLTGRGVAVDDPAEVARVMGRYTADRGIEEDMPAELFTIDLATVVVVSVADDQLVIDRWSATDGRKTVRRT
ncbi:pyridoxamine 5'-phosphate oxidase family protein [Aquihabitans sp. McL0605]|uniref:pyridoxamine 5'-phosphate oxidase family protein n=1 Tax=Aquihabitans sp. McL0605 TaxID=3415671 RepID=UPI003CF334C4